MNKLLGFLVALVLSTALLSSCDSNKTNAVAATTTGWLPAPAAAAAAHPAADSAAPAAHQLAALNDAVARMDALRPTGNTDHDFARLLLEHHRGAIALADLELRDGRDGAMQAMATKIKADQQKEMAEMAPLAGRLGAAPANYQPQNPTDPFTAQLKGVLTALVQQMPAPVADPDMTFNLLMTVHHQSAIGMARAELAHGREPGLRQLAQGMVAAEQKEIQEFRDWHTRNADKLTPAAAVRYECPMGDGGKSATPGSCPKCGMALKKKN